MNRRIGRQTFFYLFQASVPKLNRTAGLSAGHPHFTLLMYVADDERVHRNDLKHAGSTLEDAGHRIRQAPSIAVDRNPDILIR